MEREDLVKVELFESVEGPARAEGQMEGKFL